ncbi:MULTISPECIES: DUF4255 domain-containing protein [Moorena]|uniref:DUF4255 domain-containing protein n=1 Tax=Moorena producens (strain JHB) TaxID=1454205 RepID=A0A1D9G2X4_MOOP1|nr:MULTISPECIES: DUF4255 domain-containing protein [Moorena]AOY81874.1 DUF4255 domain-containing protein [Moorena producens JHB]NEP35660.1 DUF4255 domain-containing protein [Moorena sp. SIO3B2]NEQ11260.1 DUF4255 domain-containing protein [Moorena sp. SIO4E2]NET63634.1 DUF4255 domain-containing protein [Moorena sp. SIO1G6]
MIHDLDKTLEELLKGELPPDLISSVTISFATPDKDFSVKPAINLFLYDVRENLELRNTTWSTERSNGRATKRRNPVRVDCSYLITAWSALTTGDGQKPEQEEHQWLGEVMKVLLRHRIIPAAVLQGSLKGMEPPIRTVSLSQSNLQSLGEFWQAMGGKPRPALNYTLTMAVEVDDPVDAGTLVTDMRTNMRIK